jgi:hypothetical protein
MEIWSVQARFNRGFCSMNGDEGITLEGFEPSWMEDGGGIIGEQPDFQGDYTQEWDTEPSTIGGQPDDDYQPPGASSLTVTDGTHTVTNVTTLSFDGAVFLVVDYGGGEAHVQCL